jgi:glycine cleavage system H protein
MSQVPESLRYAQTHEWVRRDGDLVVVGISDHAQAALGDMVFVELPQVGRKLAAEESCAVVESVKAASDVYAPIAGEVVEVNETLAGAPETLNGDPYGDGWMWKMKPADAAAIDALMDAAAYRGSLDD